MDGLACFLVSGLEPNLNSLEQHFDDSEAGFLGVLGDSATADAVELDGAHGGELFVEIEKFDFVKLLSVVDVYFTTDWGHLVGLKFCQNLSADEATVHGCRELGGF